MLKHNASPIPEPTGLQNSVHDRDDQDIELPTIDELGNTKAPREGDATTKSGGWTTLFGSAMLTALLVTGGLGLLLNSSDESQHPNWQHVSAATAASTPEESQFVHLSNAGTTAAVASVAVTSADADQAGTARVRDALLRNDLASATLALQAAQRIPHSTAPDVQQPDLSGDAGLVAALQDGRKELFQMELFDCCQEDGDVVEIAVNGSHFATVPLMNAGTQLSIPLSSGNNTITVRGTRDGRGGVTLSLSTSRGDFFAGRMRVGQAYQLGVVVQ